jgi:hypothetical protein
LSFSYRFSFLEDQKWIFFAAVWEWWIWGDDCGNFYGYFEFLRAFFKIFARYFFDWVFDLKNSYKLAWLIKNSSEGTKIAFKKSNQFFEKLALSGIFYKRYSRSIGHFKQNFSLNWSLRRKDAYSTMGLKYDIVTKHFLFQNYIYPIRPLFFNLKFLEIGIEFFRPNFTKVCDIYY